MKAAFRDVYEAYAVYTFIALLIAILLDGKRLQDLINRLADRVVKESHAVEEYEKLKQEQKKGTNWFGMQTTNNKNNLNLITTTTTTTTATSSSLHNKRPIEHIKPPCPCCYRRARPVSIAAAWLYQCQLMAFQFVMIKPLFTLLPLILKYLKIYDVNKVPIFTHSTLNWYAPTLYIVLIQNLSVFIAFYGLLSFYHGTEKELEWCNPWPKFLCIKGVVFATFWQNIMIQIFSIMGWIDMKAASQIQNLLICIEMLLASVAHFYIFPHEEWIEGYKKQKEKGIMLKDTLALVDFVNDMHLMVSRWDTGDEVEEFTTPHLNKRQTSSEAAAIYSVYNSHNKYVNNSGRSSRASSAAHKRESFIVPHHHSDENNLPLFGGERHDDKDKISSYHYHIPIPKREEGDSSPLIETKSYTNYGSCSKDVLIRSNSNSNNIFNHLIPPAEGSSFEVVGSYQSTDSSISSSSTSNSIMKDIMSQGGGGGSSSFTPKHISELTIHAKQLVLNNLRHIASDESASFRIEPPSLPPSHTNMDNYHHNSNNTMNHSMTTDKFQSPDDSLTFSPIGIVTAKTNSHSHHYTTNATTHPSASVNSTLKPQPQSSSQRYLSHSFPWNIAPKTSTNISSYHHNNNNNNSNNNDINISIIGFNLDTSSSSETDLDYLTAKHRHFHNDNLIDDVDIDNNNSSFVLELGDISSIAASITSDQHSSHLRPEVLIQRHTTQNHILPTNTTTTISNLTNNNDGNIQTIPKLTRTLTRSDDGMGSDRSEYAI